MQYDGERIANRIKAERKALKWSQEVLANTLYVNRNTVIAWEKGRIPSLADMLHMCKLFDCELSYLLCEYDCKTRIATDIQETTGLSETAINKMSAIVASQGAFNIFKQLGCFQNMFTDVDLINLLFDNPVIISKMNDYFLIQEQDFNNIRVGLLDAFTFNDLLNFKLEAIKDALRDCRDKYQKEVTTVTP